jgi:hypothetical protein
LNFETLEHELALHAQSNLLVIYSVDLPGLTREALNKLSQFKISKFGFADSNGSSRDFDEIAPRPNSVEELLAYIRGNIRSPILRAPLIRNKPSFKAKIIAIGGAGHTTGATTFALNLVQELALLGKNTLLIDANFTAPAISTLLDVRKLADEEKWRDLSTNFSVSEVNQNSISDFPLRAEVAAAHFDFMVLDLGSLTNLANDLSDRRWPSQIKIWSSTFAQELLVTSGSDFLQMRRLKEVSEELAKIKLSIEAQIFCQGAASKGKDAAHQYLPTDVRLCAATLKGRTTMVEINEKAPLRKAIAAVARQISG